MIDAVAAVAVVEVADHEDPEDLVGTVVAHHVEVDSKTVATGDQIHTSAKQQSINWHVSLSLSLFLFSCILNSRKNTSLTLTLIQTPT